MDQKLKNPNWTVAVELDRKLGSFVTAFCAKLFLYLPNSIFKVRIYQDSHGVNESNQTQIGLEPGFDRGELHEVSRL